jgi:osmotically-inducible protein OsmY
MENRFDNERFGRRDDDRWRQQQRSGRQGGGRQGFGGEHGGYSEGQSFNREQNYFGSGRQGFGDGYTGSDRDTGFGSRGYEEDFPRENSFGRGRGGFDSSFRSGGSYGRQGFTGAGSFGGRGSSNYGENEGWGGRYTENFPESERGFQQNTRDNYGQDRGWWDRTSDEVSSWFGDEEAARRRQWDERMDKMNRGRGPRNYTRSDDRITEDINDRLTDDYYLDATDIDVKVEHGDVTLTGNVDSRYAKRRAEDIAESVSGVKNVENRIHLTETSTETGPYVSAGSFTGSTTATTPEMGRGKTA